MDLTHPTPKLESLQGKQFHSFKKVLRELQKDDPETYKDRVELQKNGTPKPIGTRKTCGFWRFPFGPKARVEFRVGLDISFTSQSSSARNSDPCGKPRVLEKNIRKEGCGEKQHPSSS